jgi:hypothetical protein
LPERIDFTTGVEYPFAYTTPATLRLRLTLQNAGARVVDVDDVH